MHELSITRNIVSIVSDRARGRTIRRVNLTIGRLSGIEIQAIKFCFPMIAQGTPAEGAELVVQEIPGRARCTHCEKDVPLERLVLICPCEQKKPLQVTAGEELLVQSMEF